MVGRVTANVVLGLVSFVCATESSKNTYWRNGGGDWYHRIAFRRSRSRSRSDNAAHAGPVRSETEGIILDISQWLAQIQEEEPTIRVQEGSYEEEWKDSPPASRRALVASVRSRKSVRTETAEENTSADEETVGEKAIDGEVMDSIAKPFVLKSIWSRIKGHEFEQPELVDELVQTGLMMTAVDESENEWVEWTAQQNKDQSHSTSEELNFDIGGEDEDGSDELANGEVLVFVGKCRKKSDDYYAANIPLVKTKAIIGMAPKDLAELLLDSSKVKLYNKMSLGRTDVRSIPSSLGVTKIVSNLTRLSVGKKIQSTTLMHSRQLNDDGTYLVVSRAVPLLSSDSDGDEEEYDKSEILLGVNLLEPASPQDPNSCRATSVTHLYAPQLPTVLAKRVGIRSAIKFIQDIRTVCDDTK